MAFFEGFFGRKPEEEQLSLEAERKQELAHLMRDREHLKKWMRTEANVPQDIDRLRFLEQRIAELQDSLGLSRGQGIEEPSEEYTNSEEEAK